MTESKCLFIDDNDERAFQRVCQASRSPQFLSPLGTKLVKEAEASGKPIDLQDISEKVIDQNVQEMIEQEEKKVAPADGNKKADGSSEDKAASKKKKKTDTTTVKAPFISHNSDEICYDCGMSPCESVTYEALLRTSGEDVSKKNHKHNRATRHYLYKLYIATKYGKLGKNHRVRIPDCVEVFIHKLYPDPNNEYTGFRSAIGFEDNEDPTSQPPDDDDDDLDSTSDEDKQEYNDYSITMQNILVLISFSHFFGTIGSFTFFSFSVSVVFFHI